MRRRRNDKEKKQTEKEKLRIIGLSLRERVGWGSVCVGWGGGVGKGVGRLCCRTRSHLLSYALSLARGGQGREKARETYQ